MNQSNININEVLKASLEHQEPSIAFNDIWDKYSKNRGPVLVYKRMSVLVAAVLVLLISTKYISSMNQLASTVGSSKNMALRVASADTYNKKQNIPEPKSDKVVALFSEAASDSAKDNSKTNPQAKVKAFKSVELDNANTNTNVQKKSTTIDAKPPIAMAKMAPTETNASNIMAKMPSTVTDSSIGVAETPLPVTNSAIVMVKIAIPLADAANSLFVIWDNRSYYKTTAIVEQKDLGKSLGKTIKQTTKPVHNEDGNEFPVGTMLYSVSGEDSKVVIAVKSGEIYYRAVVKQ